MAIVAQTQSLQPYQSPTAEVHGVPLADLLARVHSMAQRYYRKHGRWEPLEEYLSAGAMALVECMHRFKPELATSGGFLSYACFTIEMAMRTVRHAAAGSHNMPKHVKGQRQDPKYTVEGFDHDSLYALRSEPARQETTVYLGEVLAHLNPHDKAVAMLYAALDGADERAIADQWQCSIPNVKKHLTTCRKRLRTWAAWTADEPSYAAAD